MDYLVADLTDVAGIEVDIVVNNAGESQSGPLEDLPVEALERLFRLNVLGPVRLTQLLVASPPRRWSRESSGSPAHRCTPARAAVASIAG